jgi:hypothetical protein
VLSNPRRNVGGGELGCWRGCSVCGDVPWRVRGRKGVAFWEPRVGLRLADLHVGRDYLDRRRRVDGKCKCDA